MTINGQGSEIMEYVVISSLIIFQIIELFNCRSEKVIDRINPEQKSPRFSQGNPFLQFVNNHLFVCLLP